MGAVSFMHTIDATSVTLGFQQLVEDAEYEYGHDSYNGTISTCNLGSVRKIADKYTKAVEKKARKIVEDEDYGRKWTANVLDLGVVYYQVVTIKKVVAKPKKPAKFAIKYVLLRTIDFGKEKILGSFDAKTQADDAMINEAFKDPSADLKVAKRSVNINNGDDTVTTVSVTSKNVNTKPKKVAPNAKVYEVHKYMYYGLASC